MCLATMIFLEARGEPLAGQIAVGQVIMNRTVSDEFPDTICEVVKQPNQFAPIVYRRSVIVEPSIVGIVAAGLYLFYKPKPDLLWFYNPDKASPKWARKLKPAFRIGKHLFLRKNK